ncbi:MAG: UvrD-helicase domain-containing protein [Armatimonadetes bacterium]|nr:UvrD-helicase domain-containing protein [Armatimonadota bacterium]MDE2207172.1 UvrD-helicase domain-containing protein [Armatimonadota bacterium]
MRREDHRLLEGLNERQREAVTWGDGPLLIFAGAGSGKTRVLTHRVAWLVAERALPPRSIVAVTFTNKAAREMRGRIEGLTGSLTARSIAAGTFHSMCARWLREFADYAGVSRNFTIYDDTDQMALMKHCLAELNVNTEHIAPRAVLSRISRAKENLLTPEAFAGLASDYFEEQCARAYTAYQESLALNDALDFDDLLMMMVQVIERSQVVRDAMQGRFQSVLVDEFQDVNAAQYRLIRRLAETHRNLCVVGDDDQSIYRFRGADVRLILQFEEDYPDAHVVKLEQNYRSTSIILNAANAVVERNPSRRAKRLWTAAEGGKPLTRIDADNDQEEAVGIVRLISADSGPNRRSLNEFAVLYRTNAQSRVLEEAMRNWSIPYRIVGGLRFYDRKEIRDIIAYLRVLRNPADSVSLKRIVNEPPRGIGNTTVGTAERLAAEQGITLWSALEQMATSGDVANRTRRAVGSFLEMMALVGSRREELTVTELTVSLLQHSGYRDSLSEGGSEEGFNRLENLNELLAVTAQFEQQTENASLDLFLEQVSLVADVDTMEESSEAVTLMTLHSAKGLEFPVVFLSGLEEGVFPHMRSLEGGAAELEEERRLCYVGITRARDELVLSWACRRALYGGIQYMRPSRFLDEIPAELFGSRGTRNRTPLPEPRRREPVEVSELDWAPVRTVRTNVTPDSPYRLGQRVRHAVFGKGVVVAVGAEGSEVAVDVAFPDVGIKKLMPSFVPLEILP